MWNVVHAEKLSFKKSMAVSECDRPDMSSDLFRTLDAGKTLKVNTIWLMARTTGTYSVVITTPGTPTTTLPPAQRLGGLQPFELTPQSITVSPAGAPVTWTINMTNCDDSPATQPIAVDDLFLVLGYEWD